MGYYTYYTLDIVTDDKQVLHDTIRTLKEKEFFEYAFEDIECDNYDLETFDGKLVKWYDHDDDMIELSKECPDVLFRLHGEGEESGDVWETEYKNGLYRYRQVEYKWPDFGDFMVPTS